MADYFLAANSGLEASKITGNISDAAVVAGYASFITAISDSSVSVIDKGNKQAKVVLDSQGVKNAQKWLDKALKDGVFGKPSTTPGVQLDIGTIITPWAMKYLIPSAIVLFTIGYLVGKK